ncbi:MAG: aspartate carbamoyltransferase [Bacillota bacterium]|nr:aspartate carbamoyltransferase [Bacillota bacterium]MDW7684933.1 aspartate carbamoyltransferase [Bacillota bacterium]
MRKNKIYHCLNAQQFNLELLEELCDLADKIREIAKTKAGMEYLGSLLNHKRAMLYFVQPSTRTFLSFYSACQILGIKCAEVRDTKTSSEVKGESEEDTVRTFSSYFDLIIMRHPKAKYADKIAEMLGTTARPVPVINAGSGKDQHPTQALLDIYTLRRGFAHRGGVDNKTVAFVGDLLRGRTIRSLAFLLTKFTGVKQYFVAPGEYQISNDILAQLEQANAEYEILDSFEDILPQLDAVYMTRLQDEWDQKDGTQSTIDFSRYSITGKHLPLMKPDALILHPLPRRQEIALEVDEDPRAYYWRQVRNGMWARAALIATVFKREDAIFEYYYSNN